MNPISNEKIKVFGDSLRGRLVDSNHTDYDEIRAIWNAMIDRRPALFAQCKGSADVVSCVKFARDNDMPFSIRSGGHHIAGNSIVENGLVIDLSHMNSVQVDANQKITTVEPGATLGDVDHETQHYGLATSLGINSTTGIAGLTLGGGFGWISRKHGMTVDSLIAADIVTADGEILHVNKDENTDLFWAIRGGGGNFGIVTRFVFKLHDIGPMVFAGLIALPATETKSILQQYRDYSADLPDELTVWAVLRKAPPLPFLQEQDHGKDVVIMAFMYVGDEEPGKQLVEPISQFAEPYGSFMGTMPYTGWQQSFDGLLTPGARNYWKSHNFKELSDDYLDVVVDAASQLPSPHTEIFIAQMGGYTGRQAIDKTAYVHREANYLMNVHCRWETEQEDDSCIAWARALFDHAKPHAMGGAYVNFMSYDEEERVPVSYGSNYDRLARIKQKYDPDNIFNMNHNIKPKQELPA